MGYQQIKKQEGDTFKAREQDLIKELTSNSKTLKLKLQYGNLWEKIKNKRFPNRWTMFVNCLGAFAGKENDFIEEVKFKLHPSYKKNLLSVKKAPFRVARKAWGYFPIEVTVIFKKSLNLPNGVATHELVFEKGGDKSTMTVEIN